MRIVVIGGTGFIGRRVVLRLVHNGHELLTVQRRTSPQIPQFVRQACCEQEHLVMISSELRPFKPDVVIDMVSSSTRQARSTVEVFGGHAGRLVSISSQDVYRAFGIFHGTEQGPIEPLPLTEDSPRRTRRDSYPPEVLERLRRLMGWVNEEYSNSEMEDVVMNAPALPCTVLRLPMVYGPGDYLHRLYPVIKRVDDRRQVIPIADVIAEWRAPRGYVEDASAAIVLAAEKPEASGQVFNVAEEESFSEMEWTRLVTDAMGWDGSIVTIPFDKAPVHLRLPGNFAQHGTCSSTRIRKRLGYEEVTTRREALQATIAWERSHPPEPAPQLDYAAEDMVPFP